MKDNYLARILVFCLFSFFSTIIFAGNSPSEAERIQKAQRLRGNGFGFAENKGQVADMSGQVRPDILYVGSGGGATVFMQNNKVSYVYEESQPMEELDIKNGVLPKQSDDKPMRGYRIDMEFAGANTHPTVIPADQVEGYSNYYYGHCPKGVTHVRKFNQLMYTGVYKNIDVQFGGQRDLGLKYNIVVKPGGNTNDIQLNYKGQDALQLRNNRIFMKTALGEIEEYMPKVYQNINGQITDVACKYILKHLDDGSDAISFSIKNYNKAFDLVIDPWITFFGGTGGEASGSVATDKLGNSIFSGTTKSADFPVKAGAFMISNKGNAGNTADVFIAKMDPSGGLIFSTYFGGSGPDHGFGIDTDSQNNIYFTGTTVQYFAVDFPTMAWGSAYMQATGNAGVQYAFLVKLSSAGSLVWSTLYGGTSNFTNGMDVAVDASDNVVLLGNTGAADLPTLNPTQPAMAGAQDAFVAKFDNTGVRKWATYYGGTKAESGYGLDTDPSNDVYFTGFTFSAADFPTVSPAQASNGDNIQAYLVKLSGSAGVPAWATYYSGVGGGGYGVGWAVAADGLGNVFLGINTAATAGIATAGAFQTTVNDGGSGCALIKFTSAGAVVWGTYVDGTTAGSTGSGAHNGTELTGIAVDKYNNIVVSGDTYDGDFPVTSCAYQTTFAGNEDSFIAMFDEQGKQKCGGIIGKGPTAYDYSTNTESAGGQYNEGGPGGGSVAVSGGFVFMGAMSPCGYYPTTVGAYQTTCTNYSGYADNYDATFLKMCLYTCGLPNTVASFSTATQTVCTATPVNFSLTNTSCDSSHTTYLWTFTGGTPATSSSINPTGIKWSASGNYDVAVKIMSPCDTVTLTQANYMTITPCAVLSSSASKTDVLCNGKNTGSATVTAISGTANYTYKWSTGSSTTTSSATNTISGLAANTYTVTITDGTSATTSTTVTITEPTALNVNAPVSTNATCGSSNGSITLSTPTGGTPAYTYSWSNTASTQNINSLPVGGYTVTVTDANGCSKTNNATVNNTNGPAPVTSVFANIACNGGGVTNSGGGVVQVDVTGGTGLYTYSWSTGATATTTSTNMKVSNLPVGTYTVTIRDANNCSSVSTVSLLTQPRLLSIINATVTNANCSNPKGSVKVAITGGTNGTIPSYGYTYSGALFVAFDDTTHSFANMSPGTYTVSVTDANNCGPATTVVTIGTDPSPITSAVVSAPILCNGGVGTINASISNGSGGTYTYSWSNGVVGGTAPISTPAASLAFLPAGTYTIAITDGACSSTTTVSLTEPPVISAAATQNTAATCGSSNGVATATASGGTAPLTYSWSSTASGQTASGLSANTYSVTITDANGCSVMKTATIINNGAPSISSVIPTNPLCAGGTGSAVASASGGTGALTYSWNTTATGQTASNLTNGIYTVTVTDVNSCSVAKTVSITAPSAITVSAAQNTAATCSNANGIAVATPATGGTGAITYTWSSGATGLTAGGLIANTYTVTATDANACVKTATVIINNSPAPTINSLTGANPKCNTGATGTATVSATGTGSLSYTWTSGTHVSTESNLAGGTYYVTVTDGNGCNSISSVTLTAPSVIVAAATQNKSATCGNSDGIAVATIATGGTGPYTYSWSSGANGMTATNLSAVVQTLTVTDANACTQTATVTINNTGGPTITSVVPTNPLCSGGKGNAVANASGGTGTLTYTWSTTAVGQTANNLTNGTYTVTVNDANNCPNVSTVTIVMPNPILSPTFVVKNESCGSGNGSIVASTSGGTGTLTYSWVATASGQTANNLAAGFYTVSVTDANGCTATAITALANNAGPAVSSVAATNALCFGGTGSALATISGGTGPYTYSWSNGVIAVTTSLNNTVNSLTASNYTVVITDANSCSATKKVSITTPSAIAVPAITATATTCNSNNGSAHAGTTGGTGVLVYSWSSGATGQTVSGLTANTYTLTVTDANGCVQTATTTINGSSGPTLNTSVSSVVSCNGGKGSVTASIGGGAAPYTYSWSTGASSITTALTDQISNVVAKTYTVTITDNSGCTKTSSILLSQPAQLTATAASTPTSCGGKNGTAAVVAGGGTTGYTYSWSNAASTASLNGLAKGSYSVTITDNNGCTSSSVAVVDSLVPGSLNVAASSQSITEGESIVITVSGGTAYSWSPSSGLSCNTCSNPVASPLTSTTYTITSKDANGCFIETELIVTVKPGCIGDDRDVFIANIFSPNGDGKNDVLTIDGNGLRDIYWAIYDRWGNVIFEAHDQSHPWDGTKNGNLMAAGTYVYYLQGVCIKTGAEIKLKGNVSIVK